MRYPPMGTWTSIPSKFLLKIEMETSPGMGSIDNDDIVIRGPQPAGCHLYSC